MLFVAKKLTFIKIQELQNFNKISNNQFKINNIFIDWRQIMSELHLKQPGFTYSACGPFTKHCERIKKIRKTGNLKHLYRNELEKDVLLKR